MTDPRSQRRVYLGGRNRVIRYDFNALCDLEESLGVTGLVELQQRFTDLGMRAIRAFTWAGVLHEEPDATIEQVGAWIGQLPKGGFEKLGEAIAEAFQSAFPEFDQADADGEGEADPTTGTGAGPSSRRRSAQASTRASSGGSRRPSAG